MGARHSTQRSNLKKSKERHSFKERLHRRKQKKLSSTLAEKKVDLSTLASLAHEVSDTVSNTDAKLVEDHVSLLEKKLASGVERCIKQEKVYEVMILTYDSLIHQCDEQLNWIQQQTFTPQSPCDMTQAHEQLQWHNELLCNLDARGQTCGLEAEESLLNALTSHESTHLQQRMRQVKFESDQLRETSQTMRTQLTAWLAQRDKLKTDVQTTADWLNEKEGTIAEIVNIPLNVQEVRTALDTRKSLLSEVRSFTSTIDKLLSDGQMAGSTDGEEKTAEQMNIDDIADRYTKLKKPLEDMVERCQQALVNHKQLDTDVATVETWLKDTEVICSKPLLLDCSLSELEEQLKDQQSLVTSAQVQENLLSDLMQRADAFIVYLSYNDQLQLKESLQTLKENLQRVSAQISERVDASDKLLTSKRHLAIDSNELKAILQSSLETLRGLQKSVGPTQQDAQHAVQTLQELKDTLSDNKAKVTKMNQLMDQLTASGQSESLAQLSWCCQQYPDLVQKVDEQQVRLSECLVLRDVYYSHQNELMAFIDSTREKLAAINVTGITVPTKLDRCKAIIESLNAKQPLLAQIEEAALQIQSEGSDKTVPLSDLTAVQNKMRELRTDAETRLSELEEVIRERAELQCELGKTIEYLHDVEDHQICECYQHLTMEVDSVNVARRRLDELHLQVDGRVEVMECMVSQQIQVHRDNQEDIHLELQHNIDDLQTLAKTVQAKFVEEENKLKSAEQCRFQYETTCKLITDWLKTAENANKTVEDRIDYDTIETQLKQQKDDLASEKQAQEQFDELLDLSEKIKPSLDINDHATLTESLNILNTRLVAVSTDTRNRLHILEKRLLVWSQYQVKLSEMNELLDSAMIGLETSADMAPESIEHAREYVQHEQDEFSELTARWQQCMSELSSVTHELERTSSTSSKDTLNVNLKDIKHKLDTCNGKAEEKQAELQETMAHWESYVEQAESLQNSLNKASLQLAPEEIDSLTSSQLEHQLEKTKTLAEQMDEAGVHLITLQKTCHQVLAQLPPCAAKATIQDCMLHIQQQYQQLEWQVKEDEEAVRSEQSERQLFISQISDTDIWLAERLQDIPSLLASEADILDRLDSAHALISEQREKYTTIPPDLEQQVSAFEQAEASVLSELERCKERDKYAAEVRIQYEMCLQEVTLWLDEAPRLMDSLEQHQAFLSEMTEQQPKLAALEQYAAEVISCSSPDDSTAVKTSTAAVQDHWHQLEHEATERGEELLRIQQLTRKFTDTEQLLSTWVGKWQKGQPECNSEEEVEKQFDHAKVLLANADSCYEQMAALDQLVESMADIGDGHYVEELRDKAGKMRHVVTAQLSDLKQHHAQLDESAIAWQEVKKDSSDMETWMQAANTTVQEEDKTLTSRQQLKVNQELMAEIDQQQCRLANIVSRRKQLGGDDSTSTMLANQLGDMRQQICRQQSQITLSVERSEAYQQEVRVLSNMIEKASQQLTVLPPSDGSAESLQQQLLEHKAVAEQIHTWQQRIDEINLSSSLFSEEIAQLKESTEAIPDLNGSDVITHQLSSETPAQDQQLVHELVTELAQQASIEDVTAKNQSEEAILTEPASDDIQSQELIHTEPISDTIQSEELTNTAPKSDTIHSEETVYSKSIQGTIQSEEVTHAEPISDTIQLEERAHIESISDTIQSEKVSHIEPISDNIQSEEVMHIEAISDTIQSEETAHIQPISDTIKSEETAHIEPISDTIQSEETAHIEEISDTIQSEETAHIEPISDTIQSEEVMHIEAISDTIQSEETVHIEPISDTIQSKEVTHTEPISDTIQSEEMAHIEPISDTIQSEEETVHIEPISDTIQSEETAHIEQISDTIQSEETAHIEPISDTIQSEETVHIVPISDTIQSKGVTHTEPISDTIQSEEMAHIEPISDTIQSEEVTHTEPISDTIQSEEVTHTEPISDTIQSEETVPTEPIDDLTDPSLSTSGVGSLTDTVMPTESSVSLGSKLQGDSGLATTAETLTDHTEKPEADTETGYDLTTLDAGTESESSLLENDDTMTLEKDKLPEPIVPNDNEQDSQPMVVIDQQSSVDESERMKTHSPVPSDDSSLLVAEYTRMIALEDVSELDSDSRSTTTLAADCISEITSGSINTEVLTVNEPPWSASSPLLSLWSEDTVGLMQGYPQSEGDAPHLNISEGTTILTASVHEILPEESMTMEERIEMGNRNVMVTDGDEWDNDRPVTISSMFLIGDTTSVVSTEPPLISQAHISGLSDTDTELAESLISIHTKQASVSEDTQFEEPCSIDSTMVNKDDMSQVPDISVIQSDITITTPATPSQIETMRTEASTLDLSAGEIPLPSTDAEEEQTLPLDEVSKETKPRTLSDVDSVSISLQLQEREDGLKAALTRHTEFQADVMEVNTHLVSLEQRITSGVVTTSDLQTQLVQNKGLQTELKQLTSCLQGLQQRDECKPNDTSISVLQGRLEELNIQADHREITLQTAKEERLKHDEALKTYQAKVADYQQWLTVASIQHASGHHHYEPTEQQKHAEQELEEELTTRLDQLDDLQKQCEQLAPMETTSTGERLRLELARLTNATTQLKMERDGKKEEEEEELEECQHGEDDIQQWIEKTKGISRSSKDVLDSSAELIKQQQQLREKLESGLTEHQDLLRTVAETPLHVLPSSDGDERSLSVREVDGNWRLMAEELTDKQKQLRHVIDSCQSKDGDGGMQYYRPYSTVSPTQDDSSRDHTLQTDLTELNECWQNLQGQVDEKQDRLEQTLQLQQLYQKALGDVSTWLDDIELRLLAKSSDSDAEQNLQDNQSLRQELQTVQTGFIAIDDVSDRVISEATPGSEQEIRQAINALADWLKILENRAQQKELGLQEKNEEWKLFQDEVRALQISLCETSQRCSSQASHTIPLVDQISENAKLQAELKGYSAGLEGLHRRVEEIWRQYGTRLALPLELSTLHADCNELRQMLDLRHGELERALSLQTQYEKMLTEYAEYLETADNKLRDEQISATDLNHLLHQFKSHKEFFSDLSSHRVLLDTLSGRVAPATRLRYHVYHSRLSSLTDIIQDRAATRGQLMTRLNAEWSQLETHLESCVTWLSRIEAQIPQDVDMSGAEPLRHAIWAHHAIQRALNAEKSVLSELTDRGRQLLAAVACPSLETALTEFSDRWVLLSNDTAGKLKQLETLVDQWEQFDRDAETLQSWMATTDNQLQLLANLDDSDLQNVTALQNNMQLFLDLKKEVDYHQPMKTRLSTVGSQLVKTCSGNMTADNLEQHLATIDHSWLMLMGQLPDNEQMLHAAQMQLLPSRQALNQLCLWLDHIEQTLRQDVDSLPSSLIDMRIMLQKYKNLKIDLEHKQLTVDFVNQASSSTSSSAAPSIQQMSALEGGERLEFAEHLGAMNRRYECALCDVVERVKSLESRELHWMQYERGCSDQTTWYSQQMLALNAYGKASHKTTIQQAITDCKVLETKLPDKASTIDDLAQLAKSLLTLPSGELSDELHVSDTVSRLNHQHSTLCQKLTYIQTRLSEMLKMWHTYDAALKQANQNLTQMQFSLTRWQYASGDMNMFQQQIARLQAMNAEFCQSQIQLDDLMTSSVELSKVCEAAVSTSLLNTVNQVKQGWSSTVEEAEMRCEKFKELLRAWQHYTKQKEALCNWLNGKKTEVERLMRKQQDVSRQSHIQQVKSLQCELDGCNDRLTQLATLSCDLIKHMDKPTIVQLTSSETSIAQQLLQLQQTIASHLSACQSQLEQYGHYEDSQRSIEDVLSEADEVLRHTDPQSTSDVRQIRARIAELKELTIRFTNTQPILDSLNQRGYQLALTETESTNLQQLNRRWHQLYADATERYKMQQSRLLEQQDFAAKCHEWMLFLQQVEKDLAAEIVGNYEDLLAQQCGFQTFQNEMYTRQQTLAAIVSDGRRLLNNGAIGDSTAGTDLTFQRKLSMLGDQWQTLVSRAAQRKAAIDSSVQQWTCYKEESLRLRDKLVKVSESLAQLHTGAMSLEKLRATLIALQNIHKYLNVYNIDESLSEVDKLLHGGYTVPQASKQSLDFTRPLYQSVQQTGHHLLTCSDHESCERINADLGSFQHLWQTLLADVQGRRDAIVSVLEQWADTESEMDVTLNWLKGVRMGITAELPESYEGLHRELEQCQAYQSESAEALSKRDDLDAQQKTLSLSVINEDSSVLKHRLQLLYNQWDEILCQVELRKQSVLKRFERWTTFKQRHQDLMARLQNIEDKVMTNCDVHIEDLLQKLNNEFSEDLMKLDTDRESLLVTGTELKQSSSEIRANDISHDMNELNMKCKHVHDEIANRTKKLTETLRAVQQLEQNMSGLRDWLARVEHLLASPVVYEMFNEQEIQHRLHLQQDIQHDIEAHSLGVASVLSLCEVLLHDADACPSNAETTTIEQAADSLQTRWHNICSRSVQRRIRIEKTWRLWQKFSEYNHRLDDWLRQTEQTLGEITNNEATFDTIKSEIRKIETIQHQVLDHLESVEQLNRLYRSVARDGRTDTALVMKGMITMVNCRWDKLASHVAAVLKRWCHLADVWRDYESTRESLLVWFARVDEQLSEVRHSGDTRARAAKVKALEGELEDNERRIDYVHQAGTYLMQKCEASDAVKIDSELHDFKQVCTLIAAKLARCQTRLGKASLGKDSEYELIFKEPTSETANSSDQPDSDRSTVVVHYKPKSAGHDRLKKRPEPTVLPALTTLTSLDWDLDDDIPTNGDVADGVETSLTDSSMPHVTHLPTDLEWKWQLIKECIGAGHQQDMELRLEQLEKALIEVSSQLNTAQKCLRTPTPVGSQAERMHKKHYELMVAGCEDSVNNMRQIEKQVKSEMGITKIVGANTQIEGLLELWSSLQTEAVGKDSQLAEHCAQWLQFKLDLAGMLAWLTDAEAIQKIQTEVPQHLGQLEVAIRRQSELRLQLETRRAVMLSLNLMNREVSRHESRRVTSQLADVNRRWDRVCAHAAVWQSELHISLLHSTAFHDALAHWQKLLSLAETETRQQEPVDLSASEVALLAKYNRFREIHFDLERSQVQILSLRDMAEEVLSSSESVEAANAKDTLHSITTQLKRVKTICATHMSQIENRIGATATSSGGTYETDAASLRLLTSRSQQSSLPLPLGMSAAILDSDRHTETNGDVSRGVRRSSFLRRVFYTAIPLQAVMLLLLGVACWLPLAAVDDDDYTCGFTNNLRRSLDPMLQYDNGPPPF